MTIANLRTKIENNWPDGLATDLGITVVNGGTLDGWVNDMQRRICRTFDFSWMKQQVYRDTTTLRQYYALPTASDTGWTDVDGGTVLKFKGEVKGNCWLKTAINYRKQLLKRLKTSIEEDSYFDNTAGHGIPECYYVNASNIWLYRKPDHNYNSNTAFVLYLLFYGYLADLSDSNTSNILTTTYPEVLKYAATAMGFRYAHDLDMAEYYMSKATEIFNEMVQADRIAELAGIEEGMQPAKGQSLGAVERKGAVFVQNPDWYSG